jgi:hypothetical protein
MRDRHIFNVPIAISGANLTDTDIVARMSQIVLFTRDGDMRDGQSRIARKRAMGRSSGLRTTSLKRLPQRRYTSSRRCIAAAPRHVTKKPIAVSSSGGTPPAIIVAVVALIALSGLRVADHRGRGRTEYHDARDDAERIREHGGSDCEACAAADVTGIS